jgi:ubiquinone/menaquinone biosynthesis C-methylase UbiE
MSSTYQTSELIERARDVIPSEHFVFSAETARDRFFKDDRMLVVKQRVHNEFRTNPDTIVDHLRACLDLSGDEDLLDLGCGNGFILEQLLPDLPSGQITGLDIAPAVIEAAAQKLAHAADRLTWIVSSADDLSMLANDSFDRVMANYMMHYVPDIASCFQQVRRVLRPGRKFLLSTDSVRSMLEMYEVHFAAMREMNAPARLFKATPKGRISLDNATARLKQQFDVVERVIYEDQLRFTEPDPFMEFYTIGHNYCCAASVPDDELPPEFLGELADRVRASVAERIASTGYFPITKLTGTLVCG